MNLIYFIFVNICVYVYMFNSLQNVLNTKYFSTGALQTVKQVTFIVITTLDLHFTVKEDVNEMQK